MSAGPMALSFSVDYGSSVTVVGFGGEIDLATSPALDHLLGAALSNERRSGDVIIDLSAVDFMGSDGVRSMLQINGGPEATGGTTFVRGASPHLRRLFDAFGVTFPAAELSDGATVAALVTALETTATAELIAAAMRAVTTSAAALLSVDACSLTVLADGGPTTVAASALWSRDLDEVQYQAGNGPCLEAAHSGVPVRADLASAGSRWPTFAHAALCAGVTDVMSMPVTGGGASGALNLYSRSGDGPDEPAAGDLVVAAAEVLSLAGPDVAATTDERLRAALETRSVISQAVGVLMAQQALSNAAAYGVLSARARGRETRVQEEAAEVLRSVAGYPPDQGIGPNHG